MTAGLDGRVRVVVADDSPEIRALVRHVLHTDGRFVVVAEAGDGWAALEEVASVAPDLLLLDLAMPALSGLEVLERLRDTRPDLPVVVFSGFAAATMEESARAAGAHRFVDKGAPSGELIDALVASVAAVPPAPVTVGGVRSLPVVLEEALRTAAEAAAGVAASAVTLQRMAGRMDPDALRALAATLAEEAAGLTDLLDALRLTANSAPQPRALAGPLDLATEVRHALPRAQLLDLRHRAHADAEALATLLRLLGRAIADPPERLTVQAVDAGDDVELRLSGTGGSQCLAAHLPEVAARLAWLSGGEAAVMGDASGQHRAVVRLRRAQGRSP